MLAITSTLKSMFKTISVSDRISVSLFKQFFYYLFHYKSIRVIRQHDCFGKVAKTTRQELGYMLQQSGLTKVVGLQ